ncbi:hypothetical protein TorRG33x02_270210 [Trema orientale]|uniref:Uncharacterized protein n=1 Tax=Trema orientale TaxID=63057 RepID=A0A2P5CX75_TREOI|nr:hypothetical protein TorRG33x02_270210 [Trema orientale]
MELVIGSRHRPNEWPYGFVPDRPLIRFVAPSSSNAVNRWIMSMRFFYMGWAFGTDYVTGELVKLQENLLAYCMNG